MGASFSILSQNAVCLGALTAESAAKSPLSLNSDTLKRVGVSVWRINTGLRVQFAFKQAALALLRNIKIHPPRLDATCMAICEYQPPLSCGLFLEVPHCDWALIFGLSPPAPGRWRGAVGTSNSQPRKHLNCVEGWVNGRTSPDFNRHNFGR